MAIAFSAFTVKPNALVDLNIKTDPDLAGIVNDETQYEQFASLPGTLTCPSATDNAACTLKTVAPKYTHWNASLNKVLNTGTAGVVSSGNPQGEQILTVSEVQTLTGWRIDQISYSDAVFVSYPTAEDVRIINGDRQ